MKMKGFVDKAILFSFVVALVFSSSYAQEGERVHGRWFYFQLLLSYPRSMIFSQWCLSTSNKILKLKSENLWNLDFTRRIF